ncbi:MAG: MarR family transcriptional regulator [Alphaproteobacteria bacterium]|nr:MarR family transcriptional regulator [Alphaproteobacteria bacterium]
MRAKYVNNADVNPSARERMKSDSPSDKVAPADNATRARPPDDREDLLVCIELLFFAYRDFTGDPDAILERYRFGRAHHRVLHFVSRNPGLRVADLLDILKITKQSLARVLKQLVDQGYVVQKAGLTDRRERLLYVTDKGQSLSGQLAELQIARLREAFRAAGPEAEESVRRFLFAMIGEDQRPAVSHMIGGPQGISRPGNEEQQ